MKGQSFKLSLVAAVALTGLIVTASSQAKAQSILNQLTEKGAKVTALGTIAGLPGYEVLPEKGSPYWIFITPTQEAIMGLPFDTRGNAIRLQPSKMAQTQIHNDVSATPMAPELPLVAANTPSPRQNVVQQTREHIDKLSNVEFLKLTNNLPSFTVGNKGPLITVFMDPRCPYCEHYYQELRPLADKGLLQYRVIPVDVFRNLAITSYRVLGLPEEQRQSLWEKNVFGKVHPDPVHEMSPEISQDMLIIDSVFRRWHPERSVPFTIYQNSKGFMQIVGGADTSQLATLISEAR